MWLACALEHYCHPTVVERVPAAGVTVPLLVYVSVWTEECQSCLLFTKQLFSYFPDDMLTQLLQDFLLLPAQTHSDLRSNGLHIHFKNSFTALKYYHTNFYSINLITLYIQLLLLTFSHFCLFPLKFNILYAFLLTLCFYMLSHLGQYAVKSCSHPKKMISTQKGKCTGAGRDVTFVEHRENCWPEQTTHTYEHVDLWWKEEINRVMEFPRWGQLLRGGCGEIRWKNHSKKSTEIN